MTLHVDLISPSERRSASALNLKAVVRVAKVAGPAVLVTLIAVGLLNHIRLNAELAAKEGDWAVLQPRMKATEGARERAREIDKVRADLAGWMASRLAWHEQLEGVLRRVPNDVQLRELRVVHTPGLGPRDVPTRAFSMSLSGRAGGAGTDDSVESLKRVLKEDPPFSTLVETVDVPRYGVDTSPDASREDRAFVIGCTYAPRAFK